MGLLNKWLLINKLRTAVKKISFLLNISVNRLRIASMIRHSSSTSPRQNRLMFRNQVLGLQSCVGDDDSFNDSEPGSASSFRSSGRSHRLLRTESCPSSEDDIDNRAELFIANFYRQLRMERQVSLDLRYLRENNPSGSISSP